MILFLESSVVDAFWVGAFMIQKLTGTLYVWKFLHDIMNEC